MRSAAVVAPCFWDEPGWAQRIAPPTTPRPRIIEPKPAARVYEPGGSFRTVLLSEPEYLYAIQTAREMREASKRQGDRNKLGHEPEEEYALHVQCLGTISELAVRKALALPTVLRPGTYRSADILECDGEVRCIGVPYYGLRLYPKDPDHFNLIGAVVLKGRERGPYRIPGWINVGRARELAKQHPEWTSSFGQARAPMTAIPQSFLQDIVTLRVCREVGHAVD